MTRTTAQRALKAYFERDDSMTQTELASRLGTAQPSVSAWVAGTSRPKAQYRQAIEALIRIPSLDWLTRKERLVLERLVSQSKPSAA